jgi:hypothetical protein
MAEYTARKRNIANIIFKKKPTMLSQALVAHAYNLSNSGGRDREDQGLKSAPANSFVRLYLEKPFIEKVSWSGSRCRP